MFKEASKLYLGIDIGASRVKVAGLGDGSTLTVLRISEHRGDPVRVLVDMLSEIRPEQVAGIAATGREAAQRLHSWHVVESEALSEGLRVLNLRPQVVISLGGESFVVYPIDEAGEVMDHVTGNRCAAGTVEFFRQQLDRMGLTLEQAMNIAGEGQIVRLSKRCSVHCKSDCTHALNKRTCSVADIVRTLCLNMAEKVAGLVSQAGVRGGRAVVIGGAAANQILVRDLQSFLPEFSLEVPEQAAFFEAFGAAHLARRNSLDGLRDWRELIGPRRPSFARRPPLVRYRERVVFSPPARGKLNPKAQYILGVDGGSTTTKAVLVDLETRRICAGSYTRTLGNPEAAFKRCLAEILAQVRDAGIREPLQIVGVATTGSSGEILSVMCGTPWYHNEIIAHARGATYYFPQVDTILEIGGQDAKFTTLRDGIPIDFVMNESCAAGTGSFIEETARNDLGVEMEQIAPLALRAEGPLMFSDQCTAFANSDIRKAFQEGATREDNLAGLVYSIADNYLKRVVGKRGVGQNVLFQGGTSRNEAVAYALAAGTGKKIVVPPDPELVGCFGIALWLADKLTAGEADFRSFRLEELVERTMSVAHEFTCNACDNRCTIQRISVGGRTYPFGGRCHKWTLVRTSDGKTREGEDFVAKRNSLLYREFGVAPLADENTDRRIVGLLNVFSVCGLYPLYSHFLSELGIRIKLSERVIPEGVRRCQSAQCFPYEIAHGTLEDLIREGLREIFVPHVVSEPAEHSCGAGLLCPIEQATPYVLSCAFELDGVRLYAPILDMREGLEKAEKSFVALGVELGYSAEEARRAFHKAMEMQYAFWKARADLGRELLARLHEQDEVGIVIVGRPYSALSSVANMGVPRKFASHGVTVLPYDMLPFANLPVEKTMYWRHGEDVLKALNVVANDSNLFAVYISNFGCGPDSFVQHYAAETMGRKPWLYLEFDSHTSDTGVMTRVAAFLDIVMGYRHAQNRARRSGGKVESVRERADYRLAEIVEQGRKLFVVTSRGEKVRLTNRRVVLAYPPMGRYNAEAGAAVTRHIGIRSIALPSSDPVIYSIGREFTTGKECVPTTLTTGALINFCRHQFKKTQSDEILVYFMPTANGPCRFGQYNVFLRKLVRNLRLEDVALISLNAETGYRGLGAEFFLLAWHGVLAAGLMYDIRALLKAAARDVKSALAIHEEQWQGILKGLETGIMATWRALRRAAKELARIELRVPAHRVPRVLLTGEIYVRFDELCSDELEDFYARQGIMVKRSDTAEWVYYTDWLRLEENAGPYAYPRQFMGWNVFRRRLGAALRGDPNARKFVAVRAKLAFQQAVERRMRRVLSRSGLLVTGQHSVDEVVRLGAQFVNPALHGEAILTVGAALKHIEHSPDGNYCGLVLIGPFNCMPTGVGESILKPYLRHRGVPFLTFQTDGGPIPSNLRSQMEVHAYRVRRLASRRLGG
ncbi:MAG: acyl-CoA dehydratase activase [Kiritimatiellia bacterium]